MSTEHFTVVLRGANLANQTLNDPADPFTLFNFNLNIPESTRFSKFKVAVVNFSVYSPAVTTQPILLMGNMTSNQTYEPRVNNVTVQPTSVLSMINPTTDSITKINPQILTGTINRNYYFWLERIDGNKLLLGTDFTHFVAVISIEGLV